MRHIACHTAIAFLAVAWPPSHPSHPLERRSLVQRLALTSQPPGGLDDEPWTMSFTARCLCFVPALDGPFVPSTRRPVCSQNRTKGTWVCGPRSLAREGYELQKHSYKVTACTFEHLVTRESRRFAFELRTRATACGAGPPKLLRLYHLHPRSFLARLSPGYTLTSLRTRPRT